MKHLIVFALASVLAASAYAHCGSCGVGDDHSHEAAAECCGSDGSCCADKNKECKEACDKPCCGEDKAKKEGKKSACCPMSGKAS